MLAALLMIGSGSIHAVVNAIVKGGRDKAAGRAVTDGTSALVLLPATLLVPLPHGAWGWLAASALLHALYLYALIRAYRVGDLSAVYPVLRGTAPLITALVTLGVLGEHATIGQIAGIALIGAAMFVMIAGRHLGRAALGWSLMYSDGRAREARPILEETLQLAERLDEKDFRIHIAGPQYVVEMIRRSLAHDFWYFSLTAFVLFGLTMAVMFRSARVFLGMLATCTSLSPAGSAALRRAVSASRLLPSAMTSPDGAIVTPIPSTAWPPKRIYSLGGSV